MTRLCWLVSRLDQSTIKEFKVVALQTAPLPLHQRHEGFDHLELILVPPAPRQVWFTLVQGFSVRNLISS